MSAVTATAVGVLVPTTGSVLAAVICVLVGVYIGIGIMALVSINRREEPAAPAASDDTAMLDYLDKSRCNLFFNADVGGGSWGFVGLDYKLLAAGKSVREALTSARLKDAAEPVQ